MFDKIVQSLVLGMMVALFLPMFSEAQDDVPTETRRITAPPSVDRPYDVLHITDNGNKVVNPETGETVFKKGPDRRNPHGLIKVALYHAHVTVIPSGTIKLRQPIDVPTSYTTLIVGPDATLVGNEKAWGFSEQAGITPIIVERRDHVNIFNFGTLDSGATKGVAVQFDGKSGGKTGINGGLLLSTGEIKGTRAAFWVVDVSNVHFPLLWAGGWGNGLLTVEGTEDVDAGFVAGLLTGQEKGQSEVIDVQPRNKRFQVNHVIGSLVKGQDEIVDINNSPNTRINKAVAYGNIGKTKEESIGGSGSQFIDKHKYGQRKNRRQTQKVWINKNSPGTVIGDTRLVPKNVKEWKTTVKLPGFPDKLPILKVEARVTAVFEDGSTEQVFAKNYVFDLINATNLEKGQVMFPGKK